MSRRSTIEMFSAGFMDNQGFICMHAASNNDFLFFLVVQVLEGVLPIYTTIDT